MSDIKIITSLEDVLIAFKKGSNYGENYSLAQLKQLYQVQIEKQNT